MKDTPQILVKLKAFKELNPTWHQNALHHTCITMIIVMKLFLSRPPWTQVGKV